MLRGTIVLTKFPFTDLTSAKRRPALVISGNTSNHNDVIVAFISSVIPKQISEFDLLMETNHPDFQLSGLKKESLIRCDNIATLNKSLFTGTLGELSADVMTQVNHRLRKALVLP